MVILDDFDCDKLGHLLKNWADNYPCLGEVKGGTVELLFTKFIVTSNYFISELFANDTKMILPLENRFKQIKFTVTY